jgi:hypothetical protein
MPRLSKIVRVASDRVLKSVGRLVVRNITRPIAAERENVSNGRLGVSQQDRLDFFLDVTDAG